MKQMKTITALMVLIVASMVVVAGEKKLEVAVGPSVSNAQPTDKHDLTLEGLKAGKTDFKLNLSGHAHTLTLSEQQVKDILAGTTVHLDAGHGQKVRITLKSEKPKSSGW